ncbi:MAG TPA: alpha/beta fold hydrolase [Ktedonobacterales bacterium]|jgi:pimeloyl-ACP methyl ester carboxylesterase
MANPWIEEIVYIATEDNIQLAGAVISPAEEKNHQSVTIVWIHGNAASFYDRPYVLIGRELARLGFTVVLGNTRGHDIATTLWKADDHSPMAGGGGSGWERMEDAPRDLAAWVEFAAIRASGSVLLTGHSKGAQKVLLYAAEQPSERLGGVALISPDLHGLRIPGDLEAARALAAEGRGMEVIPAQPWAPWYRQSAQTVVSHAKTADRLLSNASGTPVIASIRVPLLATFGEYERNIAAELATIREKATAAPHVTTEIIAGADHFYHGHETDVARTIARWASAL